MKKLAAFIFGLLISLSFYADARLVSGTSQHQHDSATGGGSSLSNTTITSPTIAGSAVINSNPLTLSNSGFIRTNTQPSVTIGNTHSGFLGANMYYDGTNFNLVDTNLPGYVLQSSRTGLYLYTATAGANPRTGTNIGYWDNSGTLKSFKAASSGYTRITPNTSTRDLEPSVTAVPGACTAITAPSGATGVVIELITYLRSANAVASRYYETGFYSDSGCSAGNVIQRALYLIREFAAVANDTDLLRTKNTFILPTPVWIKTIQEDAGGFSFAQYYISGYYD